MYDYIFLSNSFFSKLIKSRRVDKGVFSTRGRHTTIMDEAKAFLPTILKPPDCSVLIGTVDVIWKPELIKLVKKTSQPVDDVPSESVSDCLKA